MRVTHGVEDAKDAPGITVGKGEGLGEAQGA